MKLIFDLLRSNGSITINKRLATALGLEAAVMYAELLSRNNYFEERGKLKRGWFFNTVDDLKDATTLSRHKQDKAKAKLEKVGLIESRVDGMPAKRYFKIIEDSQLLEDLLNGEDIEMDKYEKSDKQEVKKESTKNVKKQQTSLIKIDVQERKKLTLNNTNNNTKKNTKKINIAEYHNLAINIISYLNDRAGKKFKADSKENIRHISGRLSEGYVLEDFYHVIDVKVEQWKSDSIMDGFLRPETLFRPTKFPAYLNEKLKKPVRRKNEPSKFKVNDFDSEDSEEKSSPDVF